MSAETIYAFRIGSRNYPSRIQSSRRREVALQLRDAVKARGETTGRLRAVSPAELVEATKALSQGVLKAGW